MGAQGVSHPGDWFCRSVKGAKGGARCEEPGRCNRNPRRRLLVGLLSLAVLLTDGLRILPSPSSSLLSGLPLACARSNNQVVFDRSFIVFALLVEGLSFSCVELLRSGRGSGRLYGILNVHQCEGSAVEVCEDATSDTSNPCPYPRLGEISSGGRGSERTLGEWSAARKVGVDGCGEGGSCRAHAKEKSQKCSEVSTIKTGLPDGGGYGIIRQKAKNATWQDTIETDDNPLSSNYLLRSPNSESHSPTFGRRPFDRETSK